MEYDIAWSSMEYHGMSMDYHGMRMGHARKIEGDHGTL